MSYADHNLRKCVLWKLTSVTLGKVRGSGKNTFWLVIKKNLLKKNAGKCHLILSSDESFPINTDNKVFKNSNDKKTVRSEFEYSCNKYV